MTYPISSVADLVAVALAVTGCDRERSDQVSLRCTSRSGDVSLNVYVQPKLRQISIWNNGTKRWDALRSIWGRLYDDQFQIERDDTIGYGFLIDRTTGAFQYATDGLGKARTSEPVGTCVKAAYLALPAQPSGPPDPPRKF